MAKKNNHNIEATDVTRRNEQQAPRPLCKSAGVAQLGVTTKAPPSSRSQLPPQPLLPSKHFFRFHYALEFFPVKQERKSSRVRSLFPNPRGRFVRQWFRPRATKCEFNSTVRIMQRLSNLCSSESDGSEGPDFHLPPRSSSSEGFVSSSS